MIECEPKFERNTCYRCGMVEPERCLMCRFGNVNLICDTCSRFRQLFLGSHLKALLGNCIPQLIRIDSNEKEIPKDLFPSSSFSSHCRRLNVTAVLLGKCERVKRPTNNHLIQITRSDSKHCQQKIEIMNLKWDEVCVSASQKHISI